MKLLPYGKPTLRLAWLALIDDRSITFS